MKTQYVIELIYNFYIITVYMYISANKNLKEISSPRCQSFDFNHFSKKKIKKYGINKVFNVFTIDF